MCVTTKRTARRHLQSYWWRKLVSIVWCISIVLGLTPLVSAQQDPLFEEVLDCYDLIDWFEGLADPSSTDSSPASLSDESIEAVLFFEEIVDCYDLIDWFEGFADAPSTASSGSGSIKAVLENPEDGSRQTGISITKGWPFKD